MTLGAVLMLGGATGGRGQEVTGAVGASTTGPSAPFLNGFVLPTLPENWSDSPVKLTAFESLGYNNNIFGVQNGFVLPPGDRRGDWYNTTNFGGSSQANWYGQQFFFNGTFGAIRYLNQVNFDSNVYTVNAGMNWTLTSRCAGTLTASSSKSPSTVTEQVGAGVNYITQSSLNETGKCAISGGWSALFNSGYNTSTNSNPVDAVNNVRTEFLAAGISYTNSLNDMFALLTARGNDYPDRAPTVTTLGLAQSLGEKDFTLNYVRNVNPNLILNGQIGATGVTSGLNGAFPKSILPHYLASISWTATPKLVLTASASRSVTPPTTLIANAQIEYLAQFGLRYQATPKITFDASASAGYSAAAFSPGLTGTAFATFLGAQDLYTVHAGLTYAMTPFLAAALTYELSERVQSNTITPQDLITVSLNYKPY